MLFVFVAVENTIRVSIVGKTIFGGYTSKLEHNFIA